MIHQRHSIACILPPDILERVVLNGTAEQRAKALRTLARDATLRAVRAQNAILRAQGGHTLNPHVAEGGTPIRTIFDCAHTEDPARARIVRNEGDEQATGDTATDEAHAGLGATYKLFWEAYDRDSIDDEGMPLKGPELLAGIAAGASERDQPCWPWRPPQAGAGLSGLADTIRSCWSVRRSATSWPLPQPSGRRWPTTPARPGGRGTGVLRCAARPSRAAARR